MQIGNLSSLRPSWPFSLAPVACLCLQATRRLRGPSWRRRTRRGESEDSRHYISSFRSLCLCRVPIFFLELDGRSVNSEMYIACRTMHLAECATNLPRSIVCFRPETAGSLYGMPSRNYLVPVQKPYHDRELEVLELIEYGRGRVGMIM